MDIHQGPDITHSPRKPGFIDRIFGRFRKDGAYPYWLKAVLPILSDGSVYDETLKRYFILCYLTGFACLVLNALAKWITGNPEIGFEGFIFWGIAYAYGFFYMWLLRRDLFEAQKFYREAIHPTLLCKFIPPEKKSERRTIRGLISTNGKFVFSTFFKVIIFWYGACGFLLLAFLYIQEYQLFDGFFLFALLFVSISYISSAFNLSIVFGYFTWESFDPPVFKFVTFVHLIGAVYLVYKINFVWGQ
ncbi:MAG: hypothetical protein H6862_04785 [Rhodospirillales bacterium]|nr:hypothetical protein [Rhodospirillales bacterium]